MRLAVGQPETGWKDRHRGSDPDVAGIHRLARLCDQLQYRLRSAGPGNSYLLDKYNNSWPALGNHADGFRIRAVPAVSRSVWNGIDYPLVGFGEKVGALGIRA